MRSGDLGREVDVLLFSGWISYDELMELGDNKYALTIAVARRARQIHDGAVPLVDASSTKPVTVALQEFREGKLRYTSRVSREIGGRIHLTEDPV